MTFNGTVTEGPSLRYEDSTEYCWTITFDKGYPSCYERFPRRWTSKTIVEWMLSYAECCGEKISNKHGSRSPYEHEVPFALVQRPQQPRVVLTQTRPSGPQEHKEHSALVQRPQQSCATEAQIGPNSQHKEQSALVQRPQQPRATVARIGPNSPREEQSALVQQPRVEETLIGPESPRERGEQSALAQRPQQPRVGATQFGPESPRRHEQQSAGLVQRQQPHATKAQPALVQWLQQPTTQFGPESPREHEEPSALVQRPGVTVMQSGPVSSRCILFELDQLVAMNNKFYKNNHSKPGGFEPRAFDPGGSTKEMSNGYVLETPRSPQAKGPRKVPGSMRGG